MIGEVFGNFRIVSRLGRGGMGEVWLAEQQNIGTRVAVKLLLPEISADAEHVQRFFNEARAVSRIQHAGIVKMFDVGFHPSGQAYLVMEFLEGESLAGRIRRTSRVTPAHIADLGRQIASVLDATHSAGITHRDLKPDNIFIVPDRELASRQRAKVLDFGIAKLTGTLAHASPRTMGTMGTPAYMAPEQWGDASKVDWRADIYSLGCLVFEMACGRPPFVVTTLAEACGKHLTEIPAAASSIVPDLPPELDELIACMLEKRPDDRPQSMDVVVKRFEAIAALVGPPPPMTLPAPNVHPAHPSSSSGRGGSNPHPELGATVGTMLPDRNPGLAATVGTELPAPPAKGTAPRLPERPVAKRRRRRGPIALIALVAFGGGGGAAAYFLLDRTAATPQVPAPVPVPVAVPAPVKADEPFVCDAEIPMPAVAGASSSAVKLRYTANVLAESEITSTLRSTWTVSDEAGVQTGDTTMTLTIKLDWGATLGDTISAELTIKKIAFDNESTMQEPGKDAEINTVRWRSDDPAAPTELESLQALIDYPIPFQMTTRGALTKDGTQALKAHLQTKNVPAHIVDLFTRDELFRTLVIQLPDPAVTVDNKWVGGELLRKLPSRGQIMAPYEFRVYAVSGNAKQVVIDARPKLKLDISGRIKELSPRKTGFQIWSLFDVERGELTSTQARACARMSIELDGKPVYADAVLHTTTTSRAVELTERVAKPAPASTRVEPLAPEEAQAAPPVPTPATPAMPVRGPANLPAMKRHLNLQAAAIKQCGIHAPQLETVHVRVQVTPEGTVASVAAASHAAVKLCLEPKIMGMKFAPSSEGAVLEHDFKLLGSPQPQQQQPKTRD